MYRARRNRFWTNLALLFVSNTFLAYVLDSWGNRWIAIFSGVGIMIMALVEMYKPIPDGTVLIQSNGATDAIIPKGTQLQGPDNSIAFVTTRSAGIRWYTRLWCGFWNRPLPTCFKVPVKRVDN
jgi:hypothetical protein